jgi:hypothetical protein
MTTARVKNASIATLVAIAALLVGGALVLVVTSGPAPRSVTAVAGQSGDAALIVSVSHPLCAEGPRVKMNEAETQIVLSAEQDDASCRDMAQVTSITVALDAPLGERSIRIKSSNSEDPLACEIDGIRSSRCSRVP